MFATSGSVSPELLRLSYKSHSHPQLNEGDHGDGRGGGGLPGPSGPAEPLGSEGGWQKSEQEEMRAWSRVGASGLGKKVGTQLEGRLWGREKGGLQNTLSDTHI